MFVVNISCLENHQNSELKSLDALYFSELGSINPEDNYSAHYSKKDKNTFCLRWEPPNEKSFQRSCVVLTAEDMAEINKLLEISPRRVLSSPLYRKITIHHRESTVEFYFPPPYYYQQSHPVGTPHRDNLDQLNAVFEKHTKPPSKKSDINCCSSP